MNQAENLLWDYVDDDSGVTAVEYGLIASVISIAILIAVAQIAFNLTVLFEEIAAF